MAANSHTIGRHIFEIDVDNPADAQFATEALSQLFHNRLVSGLEKILSDFSPGDTVIHFDRIELDIGALTRDDFQLQAGSRILEALKAFLGQKTREQAETPSQDEIPPLEMIRLFLRSGRFPWWKDGKQPGLFADLLKAAARQDPSALRQVLFEEMQAEKSVRDRLRWQLHASELSDLRHLTGRGSPAILRSAKELADFYGSRPDAIPPGIALDQELEFTLLYAGLSSMTQPESFLRLWISRLAEMTGRSVEALLIRLKEGLQETAGSTGERRTLQEAVLKMAEIVKAPPEPAAGVPGSIAPPGAKPSGPVEAGGSAPSVKALPQDQEHTPETPADPTARTPADPNPIAGFEPPAEETGPTPAGSAAGDSESVASLSGISTEDPDRMLIFFLLNGYFPGKPDILGGPEPDHLFRSLAGPARAAFQTAFLPLAADIGVMRRIRSRFSPASQIRLLDWLTGRDWTSVLDLATRLSGLFQHQPAPGEVTVDLRMVLEEEMALLFVERPEPGEARKTILKRLISRLQVAAGSEPGVLAPYFHSVITREEMEYFFGRQNREKEAVPQPGSGEVVGSETLALRIENRLDRGEFIPDAAFPTPEALEQEIIRRVRTGDQVLLDRLVRLHKKTESAGKQSAVWNPELLEILVEKVAGPDWAAIAPVMADLRLIYGQSPVSGLSIREFQALQQKLLLDLKLSISRDLDPWRFWTAILERVATATKRSEAALLTRFQQQIQSFASPAVFQSALPFRIQTAALTPKKRTAESAGREAYLHFLQFGAWPPGEIVPDPARKEAFFVRFLKDAPDEFRSICLELRDKTNLAQRLVTFLSLKTVDLLILTLTGNQQEWKELLKETDRLGKTGLGLAGFRYRPAEIREYLLQTILRDLRTGPDLVRSTRHLLTRIARDSGAEPADLLAGLVQIVQEQPYPASYRSLLQRVRAYLEPAAVRDIEAFLASEREAVLPATGDEPVFYYLRTGQFPWWAPDLEPEEALSGLLESDPDGAREALLPFLRRSGWLKKWLARLDPQARVRFTEAAAGNYAGFVSAFLELFPALADRGGIRRKDTPDAVRERVIFALLTDPGMGTDTLTRRMIDAVAKQENLDMGTAAAAIGEAASERVGRQDIRYYRLLELLEQWRPSTRSGSGAPLPDSPPESQEKEIPVNIAGSDPEKEQEEAPGQDYTQTVRSGLAAFRHFLLTGNLKKGQSHWRQADLEQMHLELIGANPAFYKTYILGIINQNRAAKRLAATFPRLRLPAAYLLLEPSMPWILETLQAVSRAEGRSLHQDQAAYFHHLFGYAARKGDTDPQQEDYFTDLAGFLAAAAPMPVAVWLDRLESAGGEMPEWMAGLIRAAKKRPEPPREKAAGPTAKSGAKKRQGSGRPEEAVYIHNAGLVILAPFLPRYFDMLEMTADGAFVAEEAAARGAHLLQYLVTGQTETPEQLMVFNKILCGLALETPLPLSIDLTEKELDISGQLLNSALANWEKMSGSTVDNLRATFLIREGRLLEHEDSWELKVESKTFDVLMEYLPWSTALVKLPWMSKRIEVEWKKFN